MRRGRRTRLISRGIPRQLTMPCTEGVANAAMAKSEKILDIERPNAEVNVLGSKRANSVCQEDAEADEFHVLGFTRGRDFQSLGCARTTVV